MTRPPAIGMVAPATPAPLRNRRRPIRAADIGSAVSSVCSVIVISPVSTIFVRIGNSFAEGEGLPDPEAGPFVPNFTNKDCPPFGPAMLAKRPYTRDAPPAKVRG